jgi:hypothetical protein
VAGPVAEPVDEPAVAPFAGRVVGVAGVVASGCVVVSGRVVVSGCADCATVNCRAVSSAASPAGTSASRNRLAADTLPARARRTPPPSLPARL